MPINNSAAAMVAMNAMSNNRPKPPVDPGFKFFAIALFLILTIGGLWLIYQDNKRFK